MLGIQKSNRESEQERSERLHTLPRWGAEQCMAHMGLKQVACLVSRPTLGQLLEIGLPALSEAPSGCPGRQIPQSLILFVSISCSAHATFL